MKLNFNFKRSTTKKINEMISANDRLHPMTRAGLTKKLRQLGKIEALKAKSSNFEQFSPKNPCVVVVTIKKPQRRRSDAPNWYPTVKALLDGFTDAEIWTDDDDETIKAVTFKPDGLSGSKLYAFEIEIKKYNTKKGA